MKGFEGHDRAVGAAAAGEGGAWQRLRGGRRSTSGCTARRGSREGGPAAQGGWPTREDRVPAGGRAEEQGDRVGGARGQATRESEPLPGRVGTAWARGAWGREQAHQAARKEVGKYGAQGLCAAVRATGYRRVRCPAPADTRGASGKLGNATQLLTRSRIFIAALLFSSCSTVSNSGKPENI